MLNDSCRKGYLIAFYGTGLRENPYLLRAAKVRRLIAVRQVVRPIGSSVRFCLGEPGAKEGVAVPLTLEIPIFIARLTHYFEVVKGAARPEGGDIVAGVFVPRFTALDPSGLLHEIVLVSDKLLDGLSLGYEAVDVFRLVAVDKLEHVVRLCLYDTRKTNNALMFMDKE